MSEKIENIISQINRLLSAIENSKSRYEYLLSIEYKIQLIYKLISKEEPLLRDNGDVSFVTKKEIVLLANLKIQLQKHHDNIRKSPLSMLKYRLLEKRESSPEDESAGEQNLPENPRPYTPPSPKGRK